MQKIRMRMKKKKKEENDIDDSNLNNIKVAEIDKLVKQGFSDEQIAEKMKIGKGEVLLIKELYLK